MVDNIRRQGISLSENEKKQILDTFGKINIRDEKTYVESLCDCINELRESGITRIPDASLNYKNECGDICEYQTSFDFEKTFGRVIYEKLNNFAKQIDSGSIWGLRFLNFDLSEQQFVDIISFVGNYSLLEDLISHISTSEQTVGLFDKILSVFVEIKKDDYDEEIKYRISCMLLYYLLNYFFATGHGFDDYNLEFISNLFHQFGEFFSNSSKEDMYKM